VPVFRFHALHSWRRSGRRGTALWFPGALFQFLCCVVSRHSYGSSGQSETVFGGLWMKTSEISAFKLATSVCPLVTTRDPAVLSFLVADTNYATRHQPEIVFSRVTEMKFRKQSHVSWRWDFCVSVHWQVCDSGSGAPNSVTLRYRSLKSSQQFAAQLDRLQIDEQGAMPVRPPAARTLNFLHNLGFL
jgi:hypothetical protein